MRLDILYPSTNFKPDTIYGIRSGLIESILNFIHAYSPACTQRVSCPSTSASGLNAYELNRTVMATKTNCRHAIRNGICRNNKLPTRAHRVTKSADQVMDSIADTLKRLALPPGHKECSP